MGAEVCFYCGSDTVELEECWCCGEMACDGCYVITDDGYLCTDCEDGDGYGDEA